MLYFILRSTLGVAKIAGTVNPTPILKISHIQKSLANAVAIPNIHSMNR